VTRLRTGPSLPEMRRIAKETAPFFGVEAVVGLSVALQSIVLSVVRTEREVGLLGSASQLFGPISMVMAGIVTSLLPTLTRQAQGNFETLKKSGTHLIELLLLMSVPSVVGIVFIADRLLVFIYGRETFSAAGILLSIFCIALINRSFVHVLGNLLYATGFERENLRIVTIRSVLYLISSILAIVWFGEIGAVFASLALDFVDLGLHYEAVGRRLRFLVNPLPIIWRPALAAAVMGAVLFVLPDGHVLIDIAVGGGVYALAIGVILFVTIGGPRQLRERYLGRSADPAAVVDARSLALAEGD
jgi:O-antigen/teichoic acid export membrane protein